MSGFGWQRIFQPTIRSTIRARADGPGAYRCVASLHMPMAAALAASYFPVAVAAAAFITAIEHHHT